MGSKPVPAPIEEKRTKEQLKAQERGVLAAWMPAAQEWAQYRQPPVLPSSSQAIKVFKHAGFRITGSPLLWMDLMTPMRFNLRRMLSHFDLWPLLLPQPLNRAVNHETLKRIPVSQQLHEQAEPFDVLFQLSHTPARRLP
eukprot:scaffold178481_cov22-Tisochrysis_lutea.AAC.1